MRHYTRFLLLLVLLLETTFGLVGYAQQVMLADSITKNPVCYATVYDANGNVIGRSDMVGYIHLQKGFEYHISHISYEPKSLVYNEDSIIFLKSASRQYHNEQLYVKETGHCTKETKHDDRRQVHSSTVS